MKNTYTKQNYYDYIASITDLTPEQVSTPLSSLNKEELNGIITCLKRGIPISYFTATASGEAKSLVWLYCHCANLEAYPFLDFSKPEEQDTYEGNVNRLYKAKLMHDAVKSGKYTHIFHEYGHRLSARCIKYLINLMDKGVDCLNNKYLMDLDEHKLRVYTTAYAKTEDSKFSKFVADYFSSYNIQILYRAYSNGLDIDYLYNKLSQQRYNSFELCNLIIEMCRSQNLDEYMFYLKNNFNENWIIEHFTLKKLAKCNYQCNLERHIRPLDNYLLSLGVPESSIPMGNNDEAKYIRILLELGAKTNKDYSEYIKYADYLDDTSLSAILEGKDILTYLNMKLSKSEFRSIVSELTGGKMSSKLNSSVCYKLDRMVGYVKSY